MDLHIHIHRRARDAVKGAHVPVNQAWLSQLEGVLGKEEFPGVFERLKSDGSLSREDLASLAAAFYGAAPPSSSRAESLKRIFTRHQKIWEFKRPTTANRSAG